LRSRACTQASRIMQPGRGGAGKHPGHHETRGSSARARRGVRPIMKKPCRQSRRKWILRRLVSPLRRPILSEKAKTTVAARWRTPSVDEDICAR
jgi:hypothetical protein